ncbi:hypothetical protein, partial [Streptomyces mirabilis]|uniref:hypothetical protein n=1 Tax=Streptomyces mirabilis TaxID=68239 RepID=UPI00339E0D87
MEHATRALDISRELGWATGEASGLGLRGMAYWSMARLDSAHDDFTAGLRIFRETGHRYFEGFGVVGLGVTTPPRERGGFSSSWLGLTTGQPGPQYVGSP